MKKSRPKKDNPKHIAMNPNDAYKKMLQASLGSGVSSMIFSPGTSAMSYIDNKFKVGDRIIGNEHASRYTVTCRGWTGVVVRLHPHGGIIVCGEEGDTMNFNVEDSCFDLLGDAIKPKKKEIVFDLSKLDALIIDLAVKQEISAVLKQHKHKDKLFKDWGLEDTVKYGRGMTFLFYGLPGTGKTYGAHCIAEVLGQELLTIGAAEIQTQEPGGANRNIQEAFKEATSKNKILFIDECDSLITNRDDVGMILGGEINTLLTEIEKSEGVVILATNRIENLDAALERRISLIVEFPEPSFTQREEIWKKMLPVKMPLVEEVTPAKLAEHKLTGGQIKNVLMHAARMAVSDESEKVGVKHFETAINRVISSKSLIMGTGSRYKQTIKVKQDYSHN